MLGQSEPIPGFLLELLRKRNGLSTEVGKMIEKRLELKRPTHQGRKSFMRTDLRDEETDSYLNLCISPIPKPNISHSPT